MLSSLTRKQWRKAIVLTVVALLLAALVAGGTWAWSNRTAIMHWYRGEVKIDRSRYPVLGIDVSSHNGDIDFERVRDDGYTFVILKASEGLSHHDSRFDRNYDNARAAGLKVGAYHFFRKNTDGLNQAKNFIEAIGWRKLDLPLVIDVEDWSNDAGVEDERTQKHLDAMVDNLRSRGLKVMVYTNGNGYKKYIRDGQVNINLWLCSFKEPDRIKHIPHQIQQYSHWGSVKGISGNVDLNVFNGDTAQWNKWLKDLQPQQPDTTFINLNNSEDDEIYYIDEEL